MLAHLTLCELPEELAVPAPLEKRVMKAALTVDNLAKMTPKALVERINRDIFDDEEALDRKRAAKLIAAARKVKLRDQLDRY